MNINEAKEEVKKAVRAYLERDESGQYEIPVERQRPILLMGPPGIGKTAIMEQIAHELGINLVSYTITHHTRQSAIGLPMISEKSYGGRNYSVTEYTMSEIIGAIYDQIERSGVKEGILFLDEINCVSETLAPTMLQFLQYKTFGSHRVPDGFVIVTAGNPPQYNKSVRDFDIVTLDRVRQINIEEDFEAWKDYAYKAGIHGAIMAYLEIKKDNFYSIKTDVDGRTFVTARGWEDLSRVMKIHEKLGIDIDERLTIQYLQNPEVARDFATYYELYKRYRELYRIPDILQGRFPEDKKSIRDGSFDEKLSIIGLLTDTLMQEFRDYARQQAVQRILFETIKSVASVGDVNGEAASSKSVPDVKAGHSGESLNPGEADAATPLADESTVSGILETKARQLEKDLAEKKEAGLIDREEERSLQMAARALYECAGFVKAAAVDENRDGADNASADRASADNAGAGKAGAGRIGDMSVEKKSYNPGTTEDMIIEKESRDAACVKNADDEEKSYDSSAIGERELTLAKEWFTKREDFRQKAIRETSDHLTNSFDFMEQTFGDTESLSGSQEMVIFITELSSAYYSLKFVKETGNDAYYRYNKLLLLGDRKQELQEMARNLVF
jgi:hypothetical protein